METVNGTIATTVNGASVPPQRLTYNSTGIRHQNRVNVTREKQQGTFLSNEKKKPKTKNKKGHLQLQSYIRRNSQLKSQVQIVCDIFVLYMV